MTDPRPNQPNFNLIARPYRYLEYLTLGRQLERCRLHYLPNLLQQKSALILGDGDGRFLAQLLAQNPHLQADAVDLSAPMLQLLRRNCEAAAPGASNRLETHQASALAFPPPGAPEKTYDLVATHFFLDCLTQPELEALIARTVPSLAPGALWLISDFRIPSGPMRLPARLLVRALYLAFRILTNLRTTHLPDHATPLTHAGLTQISRRHRLSGLLTTELWQLRPSHDQAVVGVEGIS
jgi:SAM-dependent methyltransferase